MREKLIERVRKDLESLGREQALAEAAVVEATRNEQAARDALHDHMHTKGMVQAQAAGMVERHGQDASRANGSGTQRRRSSAARADKSMHRELTKLTDKLMTLEHEVRPLERGHKAAAAAVVLAKGKRDGLQQRKFNLQQQLFEAMTSSPYGTLGLNHRRHFHDASRSLIIHNHSQPLTTTHSKRYHKEEFGGGGEGGAGGGGGGAGADERR